MAGLHNALLAMSNFLDGATFCVLAAWEPTSEDCKKGEDGGMYVRRFSLV